MAEESDYDHRLNTRKQIDTIVLNLILPHPVLERNIREKCAHYGKSALVYEAEMVDSALEKWESLGQIEPLYPEGVNRDTATPNNTYWHNKK